MRENTELAIKNIQSAIKNDSLVIFVGAGVSVNSGLPTWKELIDRFKTDINIEDDDTDFLKIAQYYYNEVGSQNYIQKIIDVFEPHASAEPNSIHKEIFQIKPRHIITTNYDNLLEKKMESSLTKYEVIKEDEDIPFSGSNHYLIKMHGDLVKKNFVLKEDDYLDYSKNFYMVSTLVKSLIMNNTILFIGYSLNDSTFNSIFRLIQQGFGDSAKKAYFFTTDYLNEIAIQYYRNKGINVIIGEKEQFEGHIGNCTASFLARLSPQACQPPQTTTQLWDSIYFLDRLYFIENEPLVNFTNLTSQARNHIPSEFLWATDSKPPFKVTENNKLINLIKEKTMFERFLDYNNEKHTSFTVNPLLKEAYALYKKHQYNNAKTKFREIANTAFRNKDYWNYLLCEFNVKHIVSLHSREKILPEPSADIDDIEKIIDSLILNGDEETKQICYYFRNEILSFKFIYRKLFKMNDLLDNIRKEGNSYKNGGFSYNNYLWEAKFYLTSLLQFINSNCITVFQYKEFKTIVARYFECLLVAYDNSSIQNNRSADFLVTSSIIEKLELEDIKIIVPHLNSNSLPALMESRNFSKLSISVEAKNYLFNELDTLSAELKNNYSNSLVNELSNYINFLRYVHLDDMQNVIDLLNNCILRHNNSKDIRTLLSIIISNWKTINNTVYNKLVTIISNQLSTILAKKMVDIYHSTFQYYSNILEKIFKDGEILNVNIEFLEERLYLIKAKEEKLKEITTFQDIIVNFFQFFDSNIKELIEEILHSYEKIDTPDVYFITNIVANDVYNFPAKKNFLLESILEATMKEKPSHQISPDPREKAIADIYTLVQKNYFTLEELEKRMDINKLRGVYPEIDWIFFNDYSDSTIEKLLKHYSFSQVRNYFVKTDIEKQILDNWLQKSLAQGRVDLKFKY